MCRKLSAFILGAGLSLAFGQIASASDLPMRQPAYKPPPMLAPTPVYNWTGFYIGGNLGGAWGNIDINDVVTGTTASPDSSGFAGGGQIGFDYQFGSMVIGIRNMFDGTSLNKDAGYTVGTISSRTNWFDTLTGRVGYLIQPSILVYVQGGAAWTDWDVTFTNTGGGQVGEISRSKTGWTLGGGIEWVFVPHWSAFVEYNYMGFGTFSNAVTTCVGATCGTFSGKANIQDALFGVNYKF